MAAVDYSLGHIRGSMAGTWFFYASNSNPKVARSNFSSLRNWCTRFNFPVPAAAGLTLFIRSFLEGSRTSKRQLRVTDTKARTLDAHNRTLEKAAQVAE